MASYKNSTRTRTRTRKRSKKTYRKKYRKTATKRMMMGGGGFNPFSTLFRGIAGNITLFRSNAKQETAATIAATKAEVAGKIAEAKTTLDNTKNAVADRAKCIAACTTSSTSTSRI